MGYPGFLTDQDWIRDAFTPAAPPNQEGQGPPSPPPAVLQPAQVVAAPPKKDEGGGFWGSLVDVLKNMPLSGGGRYSRWSLPSINEMTAGRRTLDWAKAQGLDVGQVGSVSPGEAQFRVQQAAKRRLDDPIGMDIAQQLVPPQLGEPPETMTARAWIARLPHSALPQLVAHQVQQYGLPGWGGETPIDVFAGVRGLRSEADIAAGQAGPTSAASGGPAPTLAAAPPPATTPAPAPPPTLRQPSAPAAGPSTAPLVSFSTDPYRADWLGPAAGGQQGAPPTVAPQAQIPQGTTAPARAPVSQAPPSTGQPQGPAAAQPTPQTVPGMPQPPPVPRGEVSQEQVFKHPSVTAAQAAYEASRTLPEKRQNAIALRNALATAPAKIQQEQHQRYVEQSQAYKNQMEARQALLAAQHTPYGFGTELDAQIRMDFHNPDPGDPRLADMARASQPNMVARLAATRAAETAATTQAQIQAKSGAYAQLPLSTYYNDHKMTYFDTDPSSPTRGTPLPNTLLQGNAAQREGQGTAVQLPEDDRKHMEVVQQAATRVKRVDDMVKQLYDIAETYRAQMTPEQRADPLSYLVDHWGVVLQKHPEITQLQRLIEISLSDIGKGVLGADRNLTEPDMERLRSMFPTVVARWEKIATAGGKLGTLFGRGPSVHASFPLGVPTAPDTPEVAHSTMDTLKNVLNDKAAALLRKPGFTFEGLAPRTDAEVAQARKEQALRSDEAAAALRFPTTWKGFMERAIPTPAKEAYEKGKAALGYGPSGTAPQAPRGTPGQQAKQQVLNQMRLKAVPDASKDPTGFQTYLNLARKQLGRNLPNATPQELDAIINRVATDSGVTWQRQP